MSDILAISQQRTASSPELLSVEQLSSVLHKSPASIRSDASRNPGALPPICRLPGNKRLLWRLEDISAWLSQHVHKATPLSLSQFETHAVSTGPKRGRPRKA